MSKSEVIFDIFSKKLNSLVNPKFQNVFIKSLFSIGVLLITPKLISILARLEIITNDLIVKIEFLESSDTTLSIIGSFFVLVSAWLFKNERNFEVQCQKLEELKDEEIVVNYYVCEDYERLVEINSGDLSNFPVANSILHRNSVMKYLNKIIASHPRSYRHANYRGACYSSVEEYVDKYPDAEKPNKGDGSFSYFQVIRNPSKDELKGIAKEDGLLQLMVEHDIEYPIAIVGGYEDGCCGIDLQEEFIFRKIWVSFLVVTNNTDKTLQLKELTGETFESDTFHPLKLGSSKEKSIDIPNVMLSQGKSMVVPLAVLIPPLYAFKRTELSPTVGEGNGERVQELKHESIYLDNVEDCLFFGDKINVNKVVFEHRKKVMSSSVRDFDLTNMFTYNQHWQCGSCPHLFYRSDSLVYVREVLAKCQNVKGEDCFTIPNEVVEFVIAEIESETTYIDFIEINGEIVAEDLRLTNGEQIRYAVKGGDIIKVSGCYIPDVEVENSALNGIERNRLIGDFLYSSVEK
ncbi:hypothetical protein [Shewanella oncorhynchi]|uniref:hypothetical protein n=1 Tax=Shewanella oncorhynchi TaxID=2726434 RepID=UPI003D7B19C1